MPAADGVDARARRVAARLLPTRVRRSVSRWESRSGLQRLDPSDGEADASAARDRAARRVGGHPARAARVTRALQALECEGWVSLGRVHRPGGGRRHIDHVVIGPGGVVVLDSYPWVGRIEVTRGVVQQNGFWREPECVEVARTAGAVTALLLPQHRTAVHALICVAQHDLAHHVVAPGVHVVGVTELGRVLRSLPRRLHPAEILQLHTHLRHLLADSGTPEQLTTAELDSLPPLETDAWILDADRSAPRQGLFVPVTGRSLRTAARTAARRRRPPRPWRAVDWRLFLARVLLATLVVTGAVVLGPALRAGNGSPPQPVPSSTLPAGRTSDPVPPGPAPAGAELQVEDVADDDADGPPTVVPAATAHEDFRRPPI